MKRQVLTVCGAILWVFSGAAHAQSGGLAVKAGTLHTMAGPVISGGVVLIKDGKIERVGRAAEVTIPAGYRVLEAAVVTPGLIDAHTSVGLSGMFNVSGGGGHDQDQIERSSPMQPELRALDAYNAREGLVDWLRSLGVTTAHTGHSPGAVITGQTMIVKLRGETAEEALFDPHRVTEMISISLGPTAMGFGGRGPGSRPKVVAMLRGELLKAKEALAKRAAEGEGEKKKDSKDKKDKKDKAEGKGEEKKPEPPRDLKMEALTSLLEGKVRALVTAQGAVEIAAALRLAKEFGYSWVLDGGAEAYLMLDELKAAGVPVLLHPPMARAARELENASFTTAAVLRDAGIPFAIQSGFEGYVPKNRVVLFEAGFLTGHGLNEEQALATITRDAAKILGIDHRVGTLEAGKDADLVLYDGAPLEVVSHVCTVIIDGQVVREGCR